MFEILNPVDRSVVARYNYKTFSIDNRYRKLLKSTIPTFEKPHELRTAIELNYILKILRNIPFFKELQKFSSIDLIKSLVRQGRIHLLTSNLVISQQNTPLNYFIIGLYGKFGFLHNVNLKPMILTDENQYANFFQEFKNCSPHFVQILRRKLLTQPKPFSPQRKFVTSKQIRANIYTQLESEAIFIDKGIFQNKTQLNKPQQTIVTLSPQNFVFQIDYKKFCQLMREEYSKDIVRKIQMFSTFNCFKLFQKQRLRQLVEQIQVKKFKKNDVIFKEGEEDNRIFLLFKGEIMLEKNACLNKENPNTLYKNRLQMRRDQINLRRKEMIQAIPFADFTKVFHVTTESKKVKLTRISPISILGEEQVIAGTLRQTTAKVNSQEAELYLFTVEKLERYISPESTLTIQDFLKTLEAQITNKKILYRQEKLGNEVQYLNKTARNRFYLDSRDNSQIIHSPTKEIIQTLNRTIEDTKEKPIEQENQDKSFFLTAQYDCHNFEEFYKSKKPKKKLSKTKRVTTLSPPLIPVQKKLESPRLIRFRNDERQIIKLLHGNQRTLSCNEIRPMKSWRSVEKQKSFVIDLEKPLFSTQYFNQQEQRSRKIEKQTKNTRLQHLYSNNSCSQIDTKKYQTLSVSSTAREIQFKPKQRPIINLLFKG